MNKVTTINLSGNAYQLEEQAYDALKKYLAQAAERLANDPDKDEILADFEQAIAEKCDHYLNSRKTVVTLREVKKIIEDMGPVEPAAEEAKGPDTQASEPPKRLHLLKEGAMLGGVCTGLAAYFNIDVTVIRLLFVLLAFVTGGSFILVYLVLMLIVPEARTPEEKAEAHGERFNAHEVIEKAKQKYADLSDSEKWRDVAERSAPAFSRVGKVILNATRVVAGLAAACTGGAVVALTVLLVNALWFVLFGGFQLHDQLASIATAAVVAALLCAYYIIQLPFTLLAVALRYYAAGKPAPKQSGWWVAVMVAIWMAAATTLITIGVVNASRVRDYAKTHDTVRIYGNDVCINRDKCGHGDDKLDQRPSLYEIGPADPSYRLPQ